MLYVSVHLYHFFLCLRSEVEIDGALKTAAQAAQNYARDIMTVWGVEDLLSRKGNDDPTKGASVRMNLDMLYRQMVQGKPGVLKLATPDFVERIEKVLAVSCGVPAQAAGTPAKRKASPASSQGSARPKKGCSGP